MSLIGTLADIKIADVLRLFATGKKSGVLTVSDAGRQAQVRFHKGMLIHAIAGRITGEDAVVDLFGWKQGQLTFVPEERNVTPNIRRDVDTLILEGLKVGEVRHRMHEMIPSDRAVFQTSSGPTDPQVRYSVGPAEWKVIRLLDGVLEIGEVVEASGMPRNEVHRILFELFELGFVEKLEAQKPFRVQAQGLLSKGAAELDEHIDAEWRRVNRFSNGVLRVEIRTSGGRTVPLGVSFRAGLLRDVHLPRAVVSDLGLREGDEVTIRPIA
jgi:hypothetical protein